MRELLRTLAARCDRLGLEAQPLALLAIDVAVLLALADGLVGRLEQASNEARWGAARALLASGLVLGGTVVASATLLGAAATLVGIPTVGTQFISSRADLFTAGCLAAPRSICAASSSAHRVGGRARRCSDTDRESRSLRQT
jgi:hypothetical protein